MTVGDLCTIALRRIGVIDAVEEPSAEDMATAVQRLNALIDSWRTMKLFTHALVRTTWTITANDGSYAVGAAADVNITRPVYVDCIKVIDTSLDPDGEIDLGPLLRDEEYEAISQKALTSVHPARAHYNATYPTATITFWPVPTSTTLQGVLYTPNASGSVAEGDTISVPPGYQLFYETALAVELAPDFGREPAPSLVKSAARAESRVKMVNVQPLVLRCDPAIVGTDGPRFDIETGQPT